MTSNFLLSLLIGTSVGAALVWLWLRARCGIQIERIKSETAVQLAAAIERANRIPVLELQVAKQLETVQRLQSEILRLSNLEAEHRQLLQSTEEQLAETNARLTQSVDHAAAVSAELTSSKERQATLAAEASRLPVLEQRANEYERQILALNDELGSAKESLGRTGAELNAVRESSHSVRVELDATRLQFNEAQELIGRLSVEKADLTSSLKAEREQSAEKLALLADARQSLSDQFKTLAGDILEEKSRKFTEQNQTNLGQLLDPLKLKISEFQTKVEDVYVKETKDRSALGEQVRHLLTLNQSLSQDAKNLTQALKGSNKAQGNWGELILERLLESSGLRKGEEYEVQASQHREDGSRAQPDVIVRLPENRSLVVDAKVSLVAYEEFSSAEDDEARSAALVRHLGSVRTHIKGLSGRNYQTLYQLKSLDFVLMFIPIEPAFMHAVTHDRDLFTEAWDRNVLLVSPSTLMFVVRTVAHLWRQEAQSRNAQEIAKRGAELYDKLCSFVDDLDKVGIRLAQAQESYKDAHGKLSTKKGNVIRQAEMLRSLGVKPTKSLASGLVATALDNETDGEDVQEERPASLVVPSVVLISAVQ